MRSWSRKGFPPINSIAPSCEALRCPAIIFHGSEDATVAPRNTGHLAGRLSDTGERVGQGSKRRCDILSGKNEAGHPMEVWRIAGAGHAWAGGSPKGSYIDPAGPAEMARFFLSLG
jgi:poly(3-hydroxybutyrate) depolymerase